MASEEIISIYRVDIEQFKTQLRELEGRFAATENSAQANVRKLNAVLNEQREILKLEVENLKELEKQATKATGAIRSGLNQSIKESKFNIDALNKSIGDTKGQLDKGKIAAKQLGSEIKETEKSSKAFHGQLLQVGAALGIAFGVQQLISFGKESIALAAKAEGIRIAFAKIGDETTLEKLRTATRGATSDIDLMAAALRAKNFGISTDLLAKGLELAGKVARTTGQDVTYLTDSFVDGLGRKSLRILDNLQISQVQLQKEIKRTGDFNTAVGNIVNAKLAEMGDVTDTNADKVARLGAAYENFKVDAGSVLLFIAGGLDFGTEASDRFNASLSKNPLLLKGLLGALGGDLSKQTDEELQKTFDTVNKAVQEQNKNLEDVQNNSVEAQRLTTINTEIKKRIEAKKAAQAELDAKKQLLSGLSKLTKQELEDLGTDEAKEELKRRKRIEDANKQIEELTRAREKAIIDEMQDGLTKQVALENEKNREILQKLHDIIPLSSEATRLKNEAILSQEKAHKQNLLDVETKYIADADKKLKEYSDNVLEEQVKLAKEESDSFEKNVKEAETRASDASQRRILSTVAGTKERTQAEIDELKLANDFILAEGENLSIAQQNQVALNNERLLELERDLKQKRIDQFAQIAQAAEQLLGILNQYSQAQTEQEVANINEKAQRDLEQNQKVFDASKQTVEDKRRFEKQKSDIDAKAKADSSKLLRSQAEQNKAFSIFSIVLNTAQAITAALAIPVYGEFKAVLAGIIGAAELAAAIATPIPKFFHGTSYLERGDNKSGRDTIPVMAHEGERIIPTAENNKNWDWYEALRTGKFNDMVHDRMVAPALEAQLKEFEKYKEASFANNIMQSIMMNQKGLNDYNLLESNKITRKQAKENADNLIKAINKSKGYNGRYV